MVLFYAKFNFKKERESRRNVEGDYTELMREI